MKVERVILEDGSMVTWTRTPQNLITYRTDSRGRLVGVYVADLTKRPA